MKASAEDARPDRPKRPYTMVRTFFLSTLFASALVVSASTGRAAPAGPPSETGKRPSVVETTFESVDATIAAQWDFPDRSPAPLVVFIPAGGRIDRNGWNPGIGESPDRGMYAQFARDLVHAGFAIFRFDKPGAGKSSRGRYATERSNALEAYTRAVDHARTAQRYYRFTWRWPGYILARELAKELA